MKKFSQVAMALVLCGSVAQAQDGASIVSKVIATQKAAKTLSFRVAGTLTDDSGAGNQKLDVKVQSIPASNLARLTFNAPDALADNIVVVTPTEMRRYLYLTNQVMISPLKSAKGAGSAADMDMSALDFTQLTNPAQQLSKYALKVLATTGAAGSRVFQVQAIPKTAGTGKLLVWIAEQGWRPTRVQAFNAAGKVQADLNFTDYKLNTALNAAKLTALPKDAEVLRQ